MRDGLLAAERRGMARVSLLVEAEHPELAASVATLKSGRRGELINVYRLLLHSPDLAMGWFGFLNAVRFKTGIDDRTREIVIIRVAMLNRVQYVINQHVPKLALETGLTLAQCDALAHWRESDAFGAADRAVLAYTDAMTTAIGVPDDVYAAIAEIYDERQIVELTVLVGAYNMHTRVLETLRIDPEVHHSAGGARA
jgi:4-carboxymuconolactone decarboxylase